MDRKSLKTESSLISTVPIFQHNFFPLQQARLFTKLISPFVHLNPPRPVSSSQRTRAWARDWFEWPPAKFYQPWVLSLRSIEERNSRLSGEQLTRVRAFHCSSSDILMTLIVISSWYQQCRMHTILQQSTMLFPQQCTQQWISPQQCTQQSTMHSPVCLLTWLNLFHFTNNYSIVRLLSLHC